MGKKVPREKESVQVEKLTKTKEEVKVVPEEQEPDLWESDLVKMKKENQKVMQKAVSSMESEIKQNLDMKQAQSAIKALQKYYKGVNEGQDAKKNLMHNEEQVVHLSFTLAQVPSKPTPRPL